MPEVPQLVSGRLKSSDLKTVILRCLYLGFSYSLRGCVPESISVPLLLENFGIFWALKSMFHSHLVSLNFFPDSLPGFSAISTLTLTQAPIRAWGHQNALGRDETFSARLKISTFPKSYTYTVPVKSHYHVSQDGADSHTFHNLCEPHSNIF